MAIVAALSNGSLVETDTHTGMRRSHAILAPGVGLPCLSEQVRYYANIRRINGATWSAWSMREVKTTACWWRSPIGPCASSTVARGSRSTGPASSAPQPQNRGLLSKYDALAFCLLLPTVGSVLATSSSLAACHLTLALRCRCLWHPPVTNPG
eukprot:scaffold4768_cov412-Prasinococcus_capsulatus_cf.AAC.24